MSEPSTRAHGEAYVNTENQLWCGPTTAADEAELTETKVLRAFFRATRGQATGRGWHRRGGWNTARRDAPQVRLGEFDGVRVNRWGRTDQIRLSQNNIMASYIPAFSKALSNLSSCQFLTVLDLSKNSLQGASCPATQV